MCNQAAIDSNLSVLMCTYIKDRAEYLDVAIESIICQTRLPDEIVIVKDGPLTNELSCLLRQWQQKRPGLFKFVSLPENGGLGVALREGLKACSYDIVARMDADDISYPERFEKQLKFLQENPDVALVSSWMSYFENDPAGVRRALDFNSALLAELGEKKSRYGCVKGVNTGASHPLTYP